MPSAFFQYLERSGWANTRVYKQLVVTNIRVEKKAVTIIICAAVLAIVLALELIFKGENAMLFPFLESIGEYLGLKELAAMVLGVVFLVTVITSYTLTAATPFLVIWAIYVGISTLNLSDQMLDETHTALATEKLEDARIVLGLQKPKAR
jgi:hypothetical protein